MHRIVGAVSNYVSGAPQHSGLDLRAMNECKDLWRIIFRKLDNQIVTLRFEAIPCGCWTLWHGVSEPSRVDCNDINFKNELFYYMNPTCRVGIQACATARSKLGDLTPYGIGMPLFPTSQTSDIHPTPDLTASCPHVHPIFHLVDSAPSGGAFFKIF